MNSFTPYCWLLNNLSECTEMTKKRKPLRGDIDTHNLEESVDHVYHTSQPLDPSIQWSYPNSGPLQRNGFGRSSHVLWKMIFILLIIFEQVSVSYSYILFIFFFFFLFLILSIKWLYKYYYSIVKLSWQKNQIINIINEYVCPCLNFHSVNFTFINIYRMMSSSWWRFRPKSQLESCVGLQV